MHDATLQSLFSLEMKKKSEVNIRQVTNDEVLRDRCHDGCPGFLDNFS